MDPAVGDDQRPHGRRGSRGPGAGPPGGDAPRLPVGPVRRPRRLRLRRRQAPARTPRPDQHHEPEEGTAMADTHVTITGNLTDDPDLRYTPNGTEVANFRLAVTARVKDGDSWRDGETSFFRINVWRQRAEHVAESLSKGDRAVVIGRLKSRSWETPEGDKRSVVEVEADEVDPSLRGDIAKPERAANGSKGKGGEFNDDAPF